jgi:hypothetical protein
MWWHNSVSTIWAIGCKFNRCYLFWSIWVIKFSLCYWPLVAYSIYFIVYFLMYFFFKYGFCLFLWHNPKTKKCYLFSFTEKICEKVHGFLIRSFVILPYLLFKTGVHSYHEKNFRYFLPRVKFAFNVYIFKTFKFGS